MKFKQYILNESFKDVKTKWVKGGVVPNVVDEYIDMFKEMVKDVFNKFKIPYKKFKSFSIKRIDKKFGTIYKLEPKPL